MSQQKPETRAVVFDMDGVLIDSHPAHRAAWESFLQSLGVRVSEDDLSFILEGRTRSEILRHFLGDLPEEQLQEYGRRKDEIFRDLEHSIQPGPGVMAFLSKVEQMGLSCAVATSASEIRTASTIERLGLSAYFDAIITAADVNLGKPHPQVYRLACERLGVAPKQALAFDDAPAGVLSARSAGLRCIGVTSNGGSQKLLAAGAETVISGFTDLSMESFLPACRPV
ncbi:MAG TPA: HAD family phosphatase [Terriglobales bacterium]